MSATTAPTASCTSENTFTRTISVQLEHLDLLDEKTKFAQKIELADLPGDWCIEYEYEDGQPTFAIAFEGVPVGSLGTKASQELELRCLRPDGRELTIVSQEFERERLFPDGTYLFLGLSVSHADIEDAKRSTAGLGAFQYDPTKDRTYCFVATFQGENPLPGSASAVAIHPPAFAVDTPDVYDVCLVFPRSTADTAADASFRLYTSRDLLTSASPYFSDLFSSGFAEADSSSSSKRKRRLEAATLSKADLEDSDEEVDDYYAKTTLLTATPIPPRFREIVITETAYTTYRNVLTFFSTGLISFAPPPSADLTTSRARRHAYKQRAIALGAEVIESSPKFVYRLAHFLQVPVLESLSLAHYRNNLTPTSAPAELVHPVVLLYEPLQKEVVSYIVEHFAEVEKTEEYKAVMARITNGEVATAGPVLVALLAAEREKAARGAV